MIKIKSHKRKPIAAMVTDHKAQISSITPLFNTGEGKSSSPDKAHCIVVKYSYSGKEIGQVIKLDDQGFLIIAHIAYCCGIEDGSEIELKDLIGKELMIRIGGQGIEKQFKINS